MSAKSHLKKIGCQKNKPYVYNKIKQNMNKIIPVETIDMDKRLVRALDFYPMEKVNGFTPPIRYRPKYYTNRTV